MESTEKIPLKSFDAQQLYQQLQPFGCDIRLARRIQSSIFKLRYPQLDYLPHANKKTMKRIMDNTYMPALIPVERQISPTDGFTKYIFQGEGGDLFESVRIPLIYGNGKNRFVACVSTQIGCSMGCNFCATAKLGFKRNLKIWEITDQVLQIANDSEYPVRGVVFMGMGEPFLNYESVINAAQIFNEPSAFAIENKSISISTVGIVPNIIRFADEGHGFRLIISLSSADHEKRRILMPAEDKWPLSEIAKALRYYHEKTGKISYIAWTLIDGFNDKEEDIIKLADLLKGIPIILDLIEINDPSGLHKNTNQEQRNAFVSAIRKHLKMPFSVRYSGGRDINGACGMLALSYSKEKANKEIYPLPKRPQYRWP